MMITNLNDLSGVWVIRPDSVVSSGKNSSVDTINIVNGYVRSDGEICVLMDTGGITTLKAMLAGYTLIDTKE